MRPTITVPQFNALTNFQRHAFHAAEGTTTGPGSQASVIHGADESQLEVCFILHTSTEGVRTVSEEMPKYTAEILLRRYKEQGALPEGVASLDVYSSERGRIYSAFSFVEGGDLHFFHCDYGNPTVFQG